MGRSRDIAKFLSATEAENTDNNALLHTGSSVGVDSAQVKNIGVASYDTLDSLPISNLVAGQQAFVKDARRLYVSNGSGWFNTAVANSTPRWDSGGEPDTEYTIADSATPLIITARAIDSDNSNVNLLNQSFGTDSAQYMVDISNDSSVFTFTPKSADSIGQEVAAGNLTDSNGDFVYTFKWSDGINFISKAVTIAYNVTGGGAGFSALSEQAPNGGTLRSYTSSVTGDVFYYSGLSPSANNYYSQVALTTSPGGVFYIAMIGAGGGNGRAVGEGGAGGLGVAKITVPAGVTSMTIVAGAGGLTQVSTSAMAGGLLGGGDGGVSSNATYGQTTSGGGYTGLFTGTSASFSNAVAVVGAGGGGGNWTGGYGETGGYGGSFNQNGGDGQSSHTPADDLNGKGGTLSAGGAASGETRAYSSNNAQDGSQLQGGNGSGSNWDAGSGGGAGYYGGGGGGGGGGYDGGPGGGGSGYLNLTYGTIMHNNGTYSTSGGQELNTDGNSFNSGYLTQYVQTVTGATDFTNSNTGISTGHGQGGNTSVRQHGQFVIWNAPA